MPETAFPEAFPTIEECYRAAYQEGLERLLRTVDEAADRKTAWLERLRSGLVAALGFFDDQPSWARLLVLETPLSGTLAFECRQQLHGVLAGLLECDRDANADRESSRTAGSPRLVATLSGELVVGGVFSVIRTSILEGCGKLVELAPSLMAFIVAPYLGQAAAQAEFDGKPFRAAQESTTKSAFVRAQEISRSAQLPIRATHRTRLVLHAIAQTPYSNNREIARAAGIVDEGQTSKLLGRLEGKGVIENVGVGATRGEPNAWLLTAEGRHAVQLLDDNPPQRDSMARPSRGLRGAT